MDDKNFHQRENIRERVKRFSRIANVIYWSAILNLVSFFIILIKGNTTYVLGYALNILLHHSIMNLNINIIWCYIISLITCLIGSSVFVILAILVKKGKLKPLIISFIIYLGDTILLLFIPHDYIIINDNTSNLVMCYLVHIVMMGYLIYLLCTYNKIVKDSLISKKKNNQKEN